MHSYPFWILFGILFSAPISYAQNSCHLRELDLCIASGLASGQNLPTTIAEINKQCNGLKEMNDCINNYSKRCSTKSLREFVRSITSQGDVRSWYNEFCTNENSQERERYLKHATCLNQAHKDTRTCVRDLTVALDKAINSDVEKRIPEICCAVRRMRKCSHDIVESKCGKDGLKYMNQMLQSVAGTRLPEIACRDFDPTSKRCLSILPPPGTKPGNTRSNSVLSRLLNTYSAL
ncbi:hypothetical protein SSS_08121 [Sarcoptes scabiei]|uniref:Uncharacterized protein n=1 Tax=Sarcoptes scabiei TaxID=52283 RepID=A0A834VHV8_SARSC|nr:hypothetical protein SSS_08121 [Sarcoptes scabiei]